MGIVSSVYDGLSLPVDALAAKGMKKHSLELLDTEGHLERRSSIEMVGLRKYGDPVRNVPYEERKRGIYSAGPICLKCNCPKGGYYRYCRFCGVRFLGGLYQDDVCEKLREGAFLDDDGCCGSCHAQINDDMNFCPECGTMIVRRDMSSGRIVQLGAEFWGRDFAPECVDVSGFCSPS